MNPPASKGTGYVGHPPAHRREEGHGGVADGGRGATNTGPNPRRVGNPNPGSNSGRHVPGGNTPGQGPGYGMN